MRHRKSGRKLGRNATHRLALMRNLTCALVQHERIITTVEKAKELRRFVEKLITHAKKGTLHSRRLVLARLGSTAKAPFHDNKGKMLEDSTLQKLFKEIGPRFANRPGGYTRIIKRHERRLGDAGRTAFIELLKEGEEKIKTTKTSAPAPRVTEPTPPATPDETPPPPAPAPAPEASAPPETPPPEEAPPSA